MRGTRAKKIRTIAGFKPGTAVKYLMHKDTGQVICQRPRRTYQQLKKMYLAGPK
jgi:hypothetical protein